MLGGCKCAIEQMVDKFNYLYKSGGAYNGGYPGPEASYGVMQPQVYGDGYGMHPQVCVWIEQIVWIVSLLLAH